MIGPFGSGTGGWINLMAGRYGLERYVELGDEPYSDWAVYAIFHMDVDVVT